MTYKQKIKKLKELLRRGDVQAIADEVNVSKQTIYNMFNREYQYELKEAEERAYQAMITMLTPRIEALPTNERKSFEKIIYGTV